MFHDSRCNVPRFRSSSLPEIVRMPPEVVHQSALRGAYVRSSKMRRSCLACIEESCGDHGRKIGLPQVDGLLAAPLP